MAEQAGFHSAWYAEHHFNNYSLSPSPLMTVAHVAAKTKTIRLGTAVCILPLYHPARLLAEIGFVDTVSNGRLDLGVGSGYQEFEFERFGVKIAESGDIYNEFMDVLPMGLTQKTFEYHGKYLDIPPSSIAVRCLQQPAPPIWVTSGNPVTLGRGVREKHNLFVTALLGGNDAMQNLRGKMEQVAADNGKDLDRETCEAVLEGAGLVTKERRGREQLPEVVAGGAAASLRIAGGDGLAVLLAEDARFAMPPTPA